jgi:ABC-type molybdate transport system substrate-binding protein
MINGRFTPQLRLRNVRKCQYIELHIYFTSMKSWALASMLAHKFPHRRMIGVLAYEVSELLSIQGIDYVGPLPSDVQRPTVFSAGVTAGAKEPEAARALIKFLASPAAFPAIRESGNKSFTFDGII